MSLTRYAVINLDTGIISWVGFAATPYGACFVSALLHHDDVGYFKFVTDIEAFRLDGCFQVYEIAFDFEIDSGGDEFQTVKLQADGRQPVGIFHHVPHLML